MKQDIQLILLQKDCIWEVCLNMITEYLTVTI